MDDYLSESEKFYSLKKFLDRLLPLVIIVLMGVLYLEFFVHLTHHQHKLVLMIERGILGYFLLELLVDLGVYRNNRKFLRHRRMDIMLVLPFFTVFRGVTRALRGLKMLKPFKPTKSVKGTKAVKSVKASKVARAARSTRALRRIEEGFRAVARWPPDFQHTTKALKKSREIIREFDMGFDRLVSRARRLVRAE